MSDDLQAATPSCPTCLHPLAVAGSDERPYWLCEECGFSAVAV